MEWMREETFAEKQMRALKAGGNPLEWRSASALAGDDGTFEIFKPKLMSHV